MKRKKLDCHYGCPIEATLDIVGGKWKGLILYHLLDGTKRFNELRRTIPSITQRMLTLQLRQLEEDELVNRKVYPEVPPKVEYSLTKKAKSLETILHLMRDWGAKHMKDYIKKKED